MKVGVFCVSPSHLIMAALMLDSIRQSMPGVEVYHLTDGSCPKLAGSNGAKRIAGDMPMAIRRMQHHAGCEGEWLFIDSDVIVQKDVRSVFKEKFDIALTDRDGTITNEAKYAAVMPYNIGVVFSRSKEFWRAVIGHLLTLPAQYQEWEGDQRVVCEMVRQGGQGFDVKIIPGLLYNYPPRAADDPRMQDAAICHWKGNRKKWLLESAT